MMVRSAVRISPCAVHFLDFEKVFFLPTSLHRLGGKNLKNGQKVQKKCPALCEIRTADPKSSHFTEKGLAFGFLGFKSLESRYIINPQFPRLLAYQKRSRVRLSYAWKELWSALIALAKFVASNESSLVKKMNIFAIGHQVGTDIIRGRT